MNDDMKEKLKERLSRREFLNSLWKYLGILALLEAIVLSFSLMRSRSAGKGSESVLMKSAGNISDVPPGTVMPFRSGRFFLIRLSDGGLMAISMVCSHLGCTVNWDTSEKVFKCPCHASSFDRLGNVIKSPATRGLNYHKVIVENGKIKVDLGHFITRKEFDPSVVTYV